jgi:CBS domain-containing protein
MSSQSASFAGGRGIARSVIAAPNDESMARGPAGIGRTVREAMIHHPKTCSPNASLADLHNLFDDPHVHAALVVDPAGTLVSVVERVDLVNVGPTDPASSYGCLSERCINADASLQRTQQAMSAAGRRRLAVIDGGRRLVGLLCLKASGRGFCSDHDVRARVLGPKNRPRRHDE